ncbi:MAG: class I SAM-dependent methyltransferase [Vulcanimicrobiota bacterium]
MDNLARQIAEQLEFSPVGACAACGSDHFESAYRRRFLGHDFHWSRCNHCRLVFQNPSLKPSSLWAIYNSDFYWLKDERSEHGHRMGYKDYARDEAFRLKLGRQRIRELSKYLSPRSSLLDIGCATGFFLKAAQELGYAAQGVELSADMARFGRQQYGVDITIADFSQFELPAASFDAITFWGCDSNFYQPPFARVHGLLKPRGYVYFNFWDFDHPLRPLLLGDSKILYNSLFCFNRYNTRLLLAQAGFELLEMTSEWRWVRLDSALALTGHSRLRNLARRLGLADSALWLPCPTGYLVLARKR